MNAPWLIAAVLSINGHPQLSTPSTEFDRAGCERTAHDICGRWPDSAAICYQPGKGGDQNVVCHAPWQNPETASK
jgi:hypothetical protein